MARAHERDDKRWDRVTTRERCPICGQDHFCLLKPDRSIVGCMRVQDGSYRTTATANGDMYLHRLTDEPREIPAPRRKPRPEQALSDGSCHQPQGNVCAPPRLCPWSFESADGLAQSAENTWSRHFTRRAE